MQLKKGGPMMHFLTNDFLFTPFFWVALFYLGVVFGRGTCPACLSKDDTPQK